MEAATEAELKEECWQLMRRVAHKRSIYPQHCAKYVAKNLQHRIDQLVSATTPTATSQDEDWIIADDVTQESQKKFEKLASLQHFNKVHDNLQEAKSLLKVVKQISEESSCETNVITSK